MKKPGQFGIAPFAAHVSSPHIVIALNPYLLAKDCSHLRRPIYFALLLNFLDLYIHWSISSTHIRGLYATGAATELALPIKNKWLAEERKLYMYVLQHFCSYYETFMKGEKDVALDQISKEEIMQIQAEIRQEILALKPFEIQEIDQTGKQINDTSVSELVASIKDEVKKGSRATFKLTQELLAKFEALASQTIEEQEEIIQEAVAKEKKRSEQLVQLSLKAIDSLDFIYETSKKLEDRRWSEEIKKIIMQFIKELQSIAGIEEIKVEGEYIDGETMISIGTIPKHNIDIDIPQYHVYAVHERGFRDTTTGQVIRKAKVTTVD